MDNDLFKVIWTDEDRSMLIMASHYTLHTANHNQTTIERTVFTLHALDCENVEVGTFINELVVALSAQELCFLLCTMPGTSRWNHVLFWCKVTYENHAKPRPDPMRHTPVPAPDQKLTTRPGKMIPLRFLNWSPMSGTWSYTRWISTLKHLSEDTVPFWTAASKGKKEHKGSEICQYWWISLNLELQFSVFKLLLQNYYFLWSNWWFYFQFCQYFK